jgi:hypothetical protein
MFSGDAHARARNGDGPELEAAIHLNEAIFFAFTRAVKDFAD